jgi:O-antigen ligase
MFVNSPLIGNGVGSFKKLGPAMGSPLTGLHNFYLYVLAEYGIVGMILLVYWGLGYLSGYRRAFRSVTDVQKKVVFRGAFAGIMALGAQATFRTFGLTDPLFWGYIGFMAATLRLFESEAEAGGEEKGRVVA